MGETEGRGQLVAAVDLGGTKILTALVSSRGKVLVKRHHPTMAAEGPPAVVRRILSGINQLLSSRRAASGVSSLSIAAAGAIDMERGVVTKSPSLPGWVDIPLRSIVAEAFQLNTIIVNDANAAALGENYFGAGRGARNLIYITVSTGIGGGIIINGELYLGASGGAGELGHMTIDINGPRCNCGNTGCLEVLASGTAIAKEARRRLGQGEKSSLSDIVGGRVEDVTAEKVALAAQGGDALATAVVARAATYLGAGMVNLVNIFNPEVIVVGGGVAKMGDLLLNPVRQVVQERAFPQLAQTVHILPAQLGDDAGIIGAAVYAFQKMGAMR